MGCLQCVRITIIICNFLLFLVGLLLLVISVYADLQPETQDYVHASGQYDALKISLYVFLVVGALTVITAVVGCCGAYHESPCLLASYIIVLFILFLTELTMGILGYVFRNAILANTHKSLLEGVSAHMSQETNAKPDIAWHYLNTVQAHLRCCGASGPDDFNGRVPESCCRYPVETCRSSSASPDMYFTAGCTAEYTRFIKENMVYFFVAVLLLTGIELLAMVLSIALCCSQKMGSSPHIQYSGVPLDV